MARKNASEGIFTFQGMEWIAISLFIMWIIIFVTEKIGLSIPQARWVFWSVGLPSILLFLALNAGLWSSLRHQRIYVFNAFILVLASLLAALPIAGSIVIFLMGIGGLEGGFTTLMFGGLIAILLLLQWLVILFLAFRKGTLAIVNVSVSFIISVVLSIASIAIFFYILPLRYFSSYSYSLLSASLLIAVLFAAVVLCVRGMLSFSEKRGILYSLNAAFLLFFFFVVLLVGVFFFGAIDPNGLIGGGIHVFGPHFLIFFILLYVISLPLMMAKWNVLGGRRAFLHFGLGLVFTILGLIGGLVILVREMSSLW